MEYANLKSFLNGYEAAPVPQDLNQISGDFQLAGLKPLLGEKLFSNSYVRLIDLGCGNAILLKCLKDINAFSQSNFCYIGVDSKAILAEAYLTLTELELFEGASFRPLETNFENFCTNDNTIFLYRNVFHELNIEETADVILNLLKFVKKKDCIILQDMSTLPIAEHLNVGWPAELLSDLFISLGCDVRTYPDISKSGIEVFILVINKTSIQICDIEIIKLKIISSRHKQLELLCYNKNTEILR